MRHFFISYSTDDRPWAEWIAWQLESAGYTTVIQAWDFRPGSNFVVEMQRAASESERTIAVLSPSFITRLYTQSEWAAAFARDPTGTHRKLLPVKVRPCHLDGILSQIVYVDLVTLVEEDARRALLGSLEGERLKPLDQPLFPGAKIEFPGSAEPTPTLDHLPASHGKGSLGRFVHAPVAANGLLDLDVSSNFYSALSDPTDSTHSLLEVTSLIWLPSTEYLRSSQIQKFTAVSAICSSNLTHAASVFQSWLEPAAKIPLGTSPSQMTKEQRERLFVAAAESIRDCFVVCVAVPELVLGIGRRRPEIGYQALCGVFLLPLLELHRRLQVDRFHVRLSHVGNCDTEILRLAKRAVVATYPRKGTSSVTFAAAESSWQVLGSVARALCWAVNSYYNHDNRRWVRMLSGSLD